MIDDALTPCTIMLVNRLQDQPFRRPLRVLMDSGSRCSVIKWSSLPIGTKTSEVSRAIVGLTGSGQVTEEVALEDMILPEFSRTLRINDRFRCYVMDNNDIPYDVILGRDFLMSVGIDVLHSTQEVLWMGSKIPFRRRDEVIDPFDLNTLCFETLAADGDGIEPTSSILDAKYEAVDTADVAAQQKHLSQTQRDDLAALLRKFPRLSMGYCVPIRIARCILS